jgi:hypothetical protein
MLEKTIKSLYSTAFVNHIHLATSFGLGHKTRAKSTFFGQLSHKTTVRGFQYVFPDGALVRICVPV